MTDFTPIDTTAAEWLQPSSDRHFELRTDEALLGTLHFRSQCGTLATARTAQGAWTFKRVGFFNPRVTVRAHGQQHDLAVYKPDVWGRGTLAFTAGPTLTWKPGSFWQTTWLFAEGEQPLVEFAQGVEDGKWTDIFKTQATVTVTPDAPRDDMLSILLCLGMYLLTAHADDDAAVVTAAIS